MSAAQALGARLEVLLLEDLIITNGTKTIGAQNHFEPALQQDHIYDFGTGLWFLQRDSIDDPAVRHRASVMPYLWRCAELCFRVTEDFSNIVEAIEVAINITKQAIVEFGR